MLKILAAFCTLATLLAVTNCAYDELAPAPSPLEDCSTIIYSNVIDCLPYLMNEQSKPDGSCCSGFESVLKTDPDCICDAMESTAAAALGLNITNALSLAISCAISSSLTNCPLSVDVSAPVLPPGPSPNNPNLPSLAIAPSLSVGRNGAHSISASLLVLVSVLVFLKLGLGLFSRLAFVGYCS